MAVTANQRIAVQSPGKRVAYKAAASKRFYAGTAAYLTTAGYLTDVIAAGANVFAGIVRQEVDNSSGSNGDLEVECFTEGDFELPCASAAQADVGDVFYGVDNYAFNTTSASQSKVGRCVRNVSSTVNVIRIDVAQT
jgi:predicted RecA/RadA family phage recombinase